MLRVSAADDHLARHVVAEVEGELLLVEVALLDESRDQGVAAALGDGGPAHAADAVKLGQVVADAHALGGGRLGKLVVGDVDAADVDGVLGEEAGDGAGAVLDGELAAVLLVGGRLGVVVDVVVLEEVVVVRDPEVGGAGVEDDVDLLGRGADGERAVVLRVGVVVDLTGPSAPREPRRVTSRGSELLWLEQEEQKEL